MMNDPLLDLLPTWNKPVSPSRLAHVEAIVANAYGLTVNHLHMETREHWIVWPRQVAMALMREMCSATYTRIGKQFRKDHGTVMYACKLVSDYEKAYPQLKKALDQIRAEIRKPLNHDTPEAYTNPRNPSGLLPTNRNGHCARV